MTRLEALCAALRAAQATIVVESRSTMRVRGAGISALADEIRYWKPELLRGLFSSRGAEPFACARCGCEVVTAAGSSCTWCASAPTRELEIIPGSTAERAYLTRVSLTLNPSQTSQAPKTGELGQFRPNDPRSESAAA